MMTTSISRKFFKGDECVINHINMTLTLQFNGLTTVKNKGSKLDIKYNRLHYLKKNSVDGIYSTPKMGIVLTFLTLAQALK